MLPHPRTVATLGAEPRCVWCDMVAHAAWLMSDAMPRDVFGCGAQQRLMGEIRNDSAGEGAHYACDGRAGPPTRGGVKQ